MAQAGQVSARLVDTGILYALADRNDSWHKRARESLTGYRGRLIVPAPVLPEACYLINRYLGAGAERALIASLLARELIVEHPETADLVRVVELLDTYRDANIGFVDASCVAIAERLRIREVLTTDRRHFSLIRPKHCEVFSLLP